MTPVPTPFPRSKFRQLGLTNAKGLFTSKNPAILSLEKGSNGCRLEIDPDGNCFGTAWMLSSLLWAVQTPRCLKSFYSMLKEANRPGGAFGILDTDCKVKWRSPLISVTRRTWYVAPCPSRPFFRLL